MEEPIKEPNSEPNSEPNGEPKSEPNSEPNGEPKNEPKGEPSAEPAKTFSQEDIDAATKKAVEEAQKKWKEDADEAARLAKLNKDERAKEEMRIEREKFEKEKSEFAQKQLVAETANQLLERGLSKNFAERLCGKTAEETKANIDAFEKDFNAAVEKAVTERMKGNPPKFKDPDNKENDPFLAGFIN
jgi:hypothetical protein